jgi:hypothetical protein
MAREKNQASARATSSDAKEIDRTLRRIAVAHAALDADEAHWLRIADEQNVWPAIGYVHALEYLEDVFGYAPKTAQERVRVARELGALPQLEDALRCGELSHSVVRELTRVATPETLERWMEEARGRRLRDVEQMVSGRKKGDNPDAPADPKLVKHRLVLDLDGESLAIWRQMKQVFELEIDHRLDDRGLVLALGERFLSGVAANDDSTAANDESTATKDELAAVTTDTAAKSKSVLKRSRGLVKRLQHMIHLTTCRDCGGAWQDGGGVRFPVNRATLERAECNAIICDDENGKRAKATVPPAVERLVLQRAKHRCEVPGCRSSKHLAIHHIIFRSHGGTHDVWNLMALCDGHHRLLHDGFLRITGRAPDNLLFERNGIPMRAAADVAELLNVSKTREPLTAGSRGRATHAVTKHAPSMPPKRRAATKRPGAAQCADDDHAGLARAALCQLGYKAAEATPAVEIACAHVGADAELGILIKEALRQLAPK